MGSFLKELLTLTEAEGDETPEDAPEETEGEDAGEEDNEPTDTEVKDQKPDAEEDETEDKDEGTESEAEEDETAEEGEGDEEDETKDVGSVAEEQGFQKTKDERFIEGKTRQVTLLTKDEEIGSLNITVQYVINPSTGSWSLRACLAGQPVEDMVEFDTGEDPSSLVKSLEKEQKITAKQAVQNLKPPADEVAGSDE